MFLRPRFALICAIAVAAVLSAGAANYERQVALDRFGNTPVAFSLSLDELVSVRGEDERYAPCDCAAGDITFSASCARRASGDAWDAAASVTNRCARPRFLRLVFRAAIPFREYSFWNGYTNQKNMNQNRASVGENEVLAYLFPAFAAIGRDRAIVLGVDPMMLAARIDTGRQQSTKGDMFEMSFPVYLPPGDSFEARVTLASAPARYDWRDVVETWYGLFPKSYAPLPDVHPGLHSAEADYIFWNPKHAGLSSIGDQANALKKHFGGHPCWEWCYRPFARAGDWAMTDRWSVGWKGYTASSLEDRRNLIRARLAPAKYLGVAPMWYINVSWTERGMALKEFPGIIIGDNPHFGRYWDQDTVGSVYDAGGTAYEKLFRESLARIPKEFPDAKGIGWDSCFANAAISESHIGFAGTPCKSFRKGVPFVHESVGVAGLLDFNHAQFSGPHRMANAVNYKLTAPYSIAARTDAALYEGTPMTRPDWLWRLEAHRARFGGNKVMTWHSGCGKARLGWAKLDKMPPEDSDDAHRQIMDDNLFMSYYWGVVPAPDIVSENRDRFIGAVRDVLDLVVSGWHPSPACDAPEGVLVARYGDGAKTRLAVINPGYETREAELRLPGAYWPQYADGKTLKVSLPARQVMIVDPANGKARPAATLPPAPVKKPMDKGLLQWMAQSGILPRVQNDKR